MICITENNIDEKLSEVRTRLLEMLQDKDTMFIDICTPEQEKTARQNKTFHSLIDCFWESDCSSFESKNDMKWHYKDFIGLIEKTYIDPHLTEETKQMLWKAIKILPLEAEQKTRVCSLLKGEVYKEHSWAEARKENATKAINQILDDMDFANVIDSKRSKKYQEILGGLGEFRR